MTRIVIAASLLLYALNAQALSFGEFFGALMGQSGTVRGKGNVDQTLAGLSEQFNRKTPVMVDKETQLDRVTAEPGARLVYHYTVIGVSSTEVNPAGFQEKLKPQVKARLCSSAEMQRFLKNGVNISYRYKGRDGVPIGSFDFSPSDCRNAA